MSVRPRLMVLYSNDAVEVRYSDGSRLHVLPCGTSFIYHTAQDGHPVHGMKMIQQRCQYVTSDYRDLVMSALDFRNRFSERPFLCEELLEKDQIVSLYAKIKEVAWPKEVERDRIEIQEDGGVCITSKDEFGSLILSPHRRDFTVCYLAALSQDEAREKKRGKKNDKNVKPDKNKHESYYSDRTEQKGNKSCKVETRMFEQSTEHVTHQEHCVCENRNENNSNVGARCVTPKQHACGQHNLSSEGLNLSPITQASCGNSPQALSNASGSPVTPQNVLCDENAKFRPFSTPTDELEDNASPECTPYGQTAVFQDYEVRKGVPNSAKLAHGDYNADGSFLGENPIHTSNKRTKGNTQHSHSNENLNKCRQMPIMGNAQTHFQKSNSQQFELHSKSKHSKSRNGTVSPSHRVSEDDASLCSSTSSESETRFRYTWLTRHISCDECTTDWKHVVKMAREYAEKDVNEKVPSSVEQETKPKKITDVSQLRQVNRKHCVMSSLPQPLPLVCLGQHLHKVFSKQLYDDGKNPLEDPTTFSLGRLKVLLVDGVIYRIVRLQAMKVVEIYPGDGSVLVSQGMTGQFFQHIIPNGNKLEERTYSIKSPPPATHGGSWSVKSLINRGHRFLLHVRQEENMPASVGLCCWKHKEEAIFEPLSTTVLEQCEIQGHGKFTALSNGQIRISFRDRTCLDMTCDFSQRISGSYDNDDHRSKSRVLADKKSGMCRLLLPNGQYQMIDIQQPGVYKRYIDTATEWAAWVNSTPGQKKLFYKERSQTNVNMSVERELQKIQCFNYIVDKTVLKSANSGQSQSCETGAFKPYTSQDKPRPSILRNSEHNKLKDSDRIPEQFQRTVQIHSPPASYNKSVSSISADSHSSHLDVRANPIGQLSQRQAYSAVNVRPMPIGQASVTSSELWNPAKKTKSNQFDGFNSVREALLRTSSAIKDIDHLLDKR